MTRATERLSASEDLRQDAARDALILLLHVAGLTRADIYASPDRLLTPSQAAEYCAVIKRRQQHEPIQYITGQQEFYGLALHVTPAVLIPRPETEHLVESVLDEFASHFAATQGYPFLPSRETSRTARSAILDIGTGSGAIALALARHLPNAHITAVDISTAALEVAAANAAHHNLTSRIHFLESNLLDALPPGATFDAIVSNPPYVPTIDRETLHPQVRDHEPAAALFAGTSGLDIYRRLIPQAQSALKPNGLLALEIGHNHRDAIAALLAGWREVRFVNDLQQIPRVALARKK